MQWVPGFIALAVRVVHTTLRARVPCPVPADSMRVSSAPELARALYVGARHIQLLQHLDLSDAKSDNRSSRQWPYVFHVPTTVQSIQARLACFGAAAHTLARHELIGFTDALSSCPS